MSILTMFQGKKLWKKTKQSSLPRDDDKQRLVDDDDSKQIPSVAQNDDTRDDASCDVSDHKHGIDDTLPTIN